MEIKIFPSGNRRDLTFKFSKGLLQNKYNIFVNKDIPEIYNNANGSNFKKVIKMKFNFQGKHYKY